MRSTFDQRIENDAAELQRAVTLDEFATRRQYRADHASMRDRTCCTAASFSERTAVDNRKRPKVSASRLVGPLGWNAATSVSSQTPGPSAISNTSRMRAPATCHEKRCTKRAAMVRTSRYALICRRYGRPVAVSNRPWRRCSPDPENQCCGGRRRTTWDASSIAQMAGVKCQQGCG